MSIKPIVSLYNCVLKALEAIENSPADTLFNAMLIKFGLSYKQLFTNYNLFEKALHGLLGRNNTDLIINIARKEIIRMSHHKQNEPAVNKLSGFEMKLLPINNCKILCAC